MTPLSDFDKTDTQIRLLDALHGLTSEILKLELYKMGSDPRAMPLYLFSDMVAEGQRDTLDRVDETVAALGAHSDILTPAQSTFCVYRILELGARNMLEQHRSVNHAMAQWLEGGADITTALHTLTDDAIPAVAIDEQFQADAAAQGLKPFQAAFALNFVRQHQPPH